MARSGYDAIASEYYRPGHITSRNFDEATREGLSQLQWTAPGGLVLEIGAGKGRAHEFLGINPLQVVQLDSSLPMLELSDRETPLLRIWADACSIPLFPQQFSAVVGFLVDPFFGLDCLAEAYRMLRSGGQFLLTTPTESWGRALRNGLHLDPLTTRFKRLDSEDVVVLPSLLYPKDRILEMLQRSQFRDIEITDHCLPTGISTVSPDIDAVSRALGLEAHELPIVHIIRAVR
jgi:SAM-dependent methyltransferase